eukprot:1990041-Pyramimonas_sp.AAC.1
MSSKLVENPADPTLDADGSATSFRLRKLRQQDESDGRAEDARALLPVPEQGEALEGLVREIGQLTGVQRVTSQGREPLELRSHSPDGFRVTNGRAQILNRNPTLAGLLLQEGGAVGHGVWHGLRLGRRLPDSLPSFQELIHLLLRPRGGGSLGA